VFDFRRPDAARHQDGRQNGALQLPSGVELLQADDGVLSNCIILKIGLDQLFWRILSGSFIFVKRKLNKFCKAALFKSIKIDMLITGSNNKQLKLKNRRSYHTGHRYQ
jgi:hypothetical protein